MAWKRDLRLVQLQRRRGERRVVLADRAQEVADHGDVGIEDLRGPGGRRRGHLGCRRRLGDGSARPAAADGSGEAAGGLRRRLALRGHGRAARGECGKDERGDGIAREMDPWLMDSSLERTELLDGPAAGRRSGARRAQAGGARPAAMRTGSAPCDFVRGGSGTSPAAGRAAAGRPGPRSRRARRAGSPPRRRRSAPVTSRGRRASCVDERADERMTE